jgi:hypothetical protein
MYLLLRLVVVLVLRLVVLMVLVLMVLVLMLYRKRGMSHRRWVHTIRIPSMSKTVVAHPATSGL